MPISSFVFPLLWHHCYQPTPAGTSLLDTVKEIQFYLDFLHLFQTSRRHYSATLPNLKGITVISSPYRMQDDPLAALQKRVNTAYKRLMGFLGTFNDTRGLLPPDCSFEQVQSYPLQLAVNLLDVMESPPFLKNIRMQNQPAALKLLECGATETLRFPSGATPLEISIRFDLQHVVKMLCNKLKKLDAYNHEQNTPLHLAVKLPSTHILKLLLEHPYYKQESALEAVNAEGYTALMHAAQLGRSFHLCALLKANSEVNATCPEGWTALAHAIAHSPTDGLENEPNACVELLINHRASVNLPIGPAATALTLACHLGKLGIVQQLVRAGAFIYLPDCDESNQPIERARVNGFIAIIEWLEAQSYPNNRSHKRKLIEMSEDASYADVVAALEI